MVKRVSALITVMAIASITAFSGCFGVAPADTIEDENTIEETPVFTPDFNNSSLDSTPPSIPLPVAMSNVSVDATPLVEAEDREEVETPETSTPTSRPTPATPPVPVIDVVVLDIQFDPPGNDRENLNGEWVRILNRGASEVDIGGWSLADRKNHLYIFPEDFTLLPDESVKVHVGAGEDTHTELYMNEKTPIWNNDGDTATLSDANNVIIDQYSYTPETVPTSSKTATPTPAQTQTGSIGIVIEEINYDPEGNDRDNLNEEWVMILNTGDDNIDMGGWIIVDAKNHSYVFPEGFELPPVSRVKVHVGIGDDSDTDLYMNGKNPIWNNDGDTATLFDSRGEIVDQYNY